MDSVRSKLVVFAALLAGTLPVGTVTYAQTSVVPKSPASGPGQKTDESIAQIEEIVVTAQKRAQSINDVGMSINALSGDELANAGVKDPGDLIRVIPGFTYTKTTDSFPIYSLRGVGYYDNNPAATPAVTVYVDEVPLPYPLLTQGVTLDLDRVEVLKGPQGTLFGQNSTGGAINFIAAKPTSSPAAGADISYGRFNTVDLEGFVSGPLNETLKARVATRIERGDDWQKSYTRNDSIGKVDRKVLRLLMDWTPSTTFDAEMNVNGWWDKSDAQMGQLVGLTINNPGGQNPRLATGDGSPGNPLLQTYPVPPRDPRAADWTPGKSYAADFKYWQTAIHANLHISDIATLTSITSYQDLSFLSRTDADGTDLTIFDIRHRGFIHAFSQELRLSGDSTRLHWVVGGNYFRSFEHSFAHNNLPDFSVPLGTQNILSDTKARSIAGFANTEYQLTDALSLQAGLRYTHYQERLIGCASDSGDGKAAAFWNQIFGATVIHPGQCYSLDNIHFDPAVMKVPSAADDLLNEHNVSWRVGINYKLNADTLLYGNVSKGYKAGAHTLATANVLTQFAGVKQESVIGYEIGAKTTTAGRTLHVDGAIFYYDYQNKQLDAPFDTGPPFGVQDKLQNIPISRVTGAELSTTWLPLKGLALNLNGTYIESKIVSHFFGFDPFGNVLDVKGEAFPFTPKWQIVGNADYRFPLTGTLVGSVGASELYRSKTVSNFGESAAFHSIFDIDGYGLLDLRAGIETSDSKWRVQIWGRNVTNKYYRLNSSKIIETIIAHTGMPATYGVSLNMRY